MEFKKLSFYKVFIFLSLVILLFFYFWGVYLLGPSNIVDFIGVGNAYLILFVLAVTVGVSSFTAASFYSILLTFALGGANIFVLLFLSALGLTLGDLIFYYLGYKGRNVAEDTKVENKISRFSNWVDNQNYVFVNFLIFIYFSISPFPKDVAALALGFISFRLFNFIIIAFFGNMIFCSIVLFFGFFSFSFI